MRPSAVVAIILLFLVPIAGLVTLSWQTADWSHRLLAWALLLLCADQARMAIVDLTNIATLKTPVGQSHDPRLRRFQWVTWSTIGLELLGFYSAAFGPHPLALGWGGWIVLFSQVWFNSLAAVQLNPGGAIALEPWGIPQRWPVLLADALGLVMVSLWLAQVQELAMAIALLVMVAAYGIIKYGSKLVPTPSQSSASKLS
jgi:hypothetical protein